jgi:hypothetical protein
MNGDVANANKTIICDLHYASVFGESEIVVSSDSNKNQNSFVSLGKSYFHPMFADRSNLSKNFLANSALHFSTAEIEVYQII